MKYLILLSLISCATRYVPTEAPYPDVVVTPVEVPTEIKPLSPIVTITECRNCTTDEVAKYAKVTEKLREVMHSQCFKDAILSRQMIQTMERTPAQVLEHVLGQNREISIELYTNRLVRTVGYTYPNTKNIWLNRKYHNGYGICQSGSNLSHEGAGHKNGYDHATQWSKERDFSVPYSFNYAFEKCCVE